MQLCSVQLVKDAVMYSKVLYYLLVKILMNRLFLLLLMKTNSTSVFDFLEKMFVVICVINTILAMFDGRMAEFLK